MTSRLLTILTALVLTSCTVGPNYRRPAPVPGATGLFVTPTGPLTAPGALRDDWWALYDDPNIDRLVRTAFAANTDLRQAIARLAQARAVLAEARTQALPATLTSGGVRYRRGTITGAGAATGITGSGLGTTPVQNNSSAASTGGSGTSDVAGSTPDAQTVYSAGFDVAYELDLFGRVRRSIEAARADAAAQEAATDYVRVTVAAQTTQAYVGACAAAEELAVARRSFSIAQQSLELYRRRAVLGALAPFDVDRVAALAEQAAAAIPPIENQRRAALFALALVTGKTPSEIDAAANRCTAPPKLLSPIPVGDGAVLIARRPDIREAERTLAAQTARVGVATADLYPRISLGGSVAANGTSLANAVSRQGLAFALGPLISWTFPNTAAAKARIRQSRAVAEGALAAFDGAILGALSETERALSTYATEVDRNARLRAALARQQDGFNLLAVRTRFGAESPIDLLETERTLIQAQTDLAASDAAVVDDSVAVFRALGGGWQSNVTHAP